MDKSNIQASRTYDLWNAFSSVNLKSACQRELECFLMNLFFSHALLFLSKALFSLIADYPVDCVMPYRRYFILFI